MRPAETTETEEKGEGPEGAVIEGAPCPGQESKKHIRAYLYSFTCSFQYGSANRRENGKIFFPNAVDKNKNILFADPAATLFLRKKNKKPKRK